MIVSALHRHVLSHTQRDGNCRGLWHCSHRHRLHCGHVMFNGSPPLPLDGCISTSSCNCVDACTSFVYGKGCFVIADAGNTDERVDVLVVPCAVDIDWPTNGIVLCWWAQPPVSPPIDIAFDAIVALFWWMPPMDDDNGDNGDVIVVVAVVVVIAPCWWRDANCGVRNGVSTYSLASRSVSGRGAASVTGDALCVSKCWLFAFDDVFDVGDNEATATIGNVVPGGGGRLREKLALAWSVVSGTIMGTWLSVGGSGGGCWFNCWFRGCNGGRVSSFSKFVWNGFELIIGGSGARWRWCIRGIDFGGRGGAERSPPYLRSM